MTAQTAPADGLTAAQVEEFRVGMKRLYAIALQPSINALCDAALRSLSPQPRQEAQSAAGAEAHNKGPNVRDALLFVLWHHQGGSSKIGQPIRAALGIGEYDDLTEDQYASAKRVQELLARPAPPASEGMVMVPREKLKEIADAAYEAAACGGGVPCADCKTSCDPAENVRQAILALSAAPQPSAADMTKEGA